MKIKVEFEINDNALIKLITASKDKQALVQDIADLVKQKLSIDFQKQGMKKFIDLCKKYKLRIPTEKDLEDLNNTPL